MILRKQICLVAKRNVEHTKNVVILKSHSKKESNLDAKNAALYVNVIVKNPVNKVGKGLFKL